MAVRTWGLALFEAAYVLILVRYWRRPDVQAFIWAAFAIAFAAYMLPTRVHERYLLPALTLAALAAAWRLGCAGSSRRCQCPIS